MRPRDLAAEGVRGIEGVRVAWMAAGMAVGVGSLAGYALVVLIGLVVGVGAMLIYWKVSPQKRLKEIKGEVVEARRAMRGYTGSDAGEMMRLSKRSVGLAGKQLGMVMGPTVVAAVPVLLALWGLARWYGGWGGAWEWWFMGGMSVSAIGMKVALKIE